MTCNSKYQNTSQFRFRRGKVKKKGIVVRHSFYESQFRLRRGKVKYARNRKEGYTSTVSIPLAQR